MKRISFWLLSTLSAIVLLVGFDASQHGASVTATGPLSSGSTGGSGSGTSNGSGHTSGNGSGNGSGSGNGAGNGSGNGNGNGSGSGSGSDGQSGSGGATKTVTGDAAQTIWGPVQVQLTVKGSTITGVKILQYPNGNPRDVELAQYALPILMNETTAKQSAQIDMVSGATYTSEGYVQSLQSALDQANL
ncbi:MAG: FMN-binding protein [Nocardioides sp.]